MASRFFRETRNSFALGVRFFTMSPWADARFATGHARAALARSLQFFD
jgi:hypothetical protein